MWDFSGLNCTGGIFLLKIGSESVRPYFILDNRLQVAAATGSALDNSGVGVVNIILKKSPGASNIDLRNATVQLIGSSGMFNPVDSTAQASDAEGHFGIVPFNDPDDRIVMVFGLDDTDGFRL